MSKMKTIFTLGEPKLPRTEADVFDTGYLLPSVLWSGDARDTSCFTSYVYGYTETERAGYDMKSHAAKNAAECQALCQKSDECVYFQWQTLQLWNANTVQCRISMYFLCRG
eukprot:Blabericola_migrator_1__9642@NODE_526_length_7839_cov_99_241251_g402_i0_p11_GENE_NODE_526_length_7839_cov_99_241251_g402_i0NODE_526_length_7839_cov_99_241251_g402_i0_p11_ORF_typecomplete_len111_score7_32PAN_4/PF14295_6/5_6e03PAN_4/PF14295_6/4_5e06PAN_1/PF00024_26/6_8e05PAN_3/PF08277_12/0_025_NODE_526_length_7839_cov_99_241251_g402_i066286960